MATSEELNQQLQAAKEEAALTLEQLHLVQEELEVYFLKAQDLEKQLQQAKADSTAQSKLQSERDQANQERDQCKAERDTLKSERDQLKASSKQANDNAKTLTKARDQANKERDQLKAERDEASSQAQSQSELVKTAQRMLEGQARYLEDLSRKEEQADQAIDELRMLKREILHYIHHSRPNPSLDPQKIQRLIELAKQTAVP